MNEIYMKIQKIIKYNPYREYFGEWTPAVLYSTFHKIHSNPFNPLVSMLTGKLSQDTICDALWQEMSYNPIRFGTENLFEFDGVSSLQKFYKANQKSKTEVMQRIALELRDFLYFIDKSNPEFTKNNEISGTSILIKCNHNRRANNGYKALACLVRCVHLIDSQNLKDYRIKTFRKKIQEVVISRHQNLERSNKYLNIVKTERMKKQTDVLYNAIIEKNNEIISTSVRIKTLNEYDPPVDTYTERRLLSRQNQELQNLEEKYAMAKNQYEQMIMEQNTIEK